MSSKGLMNQALRFPTCPTLKAKIYKYVRPKLEDLFYSQEGGHVD